MLKIAFLSVVADAALAVGHDSAQGRHAGPKGIDDPEAYAVYASLIPEEWTVRVARAKRLVVLRETATYDRCIPSGGAMENEWKPVVDSFKAENAAVRHVLSDRNIHLPYILVPRADMTQLFKDPGDDPAFGWTHFYNRYPDSGGYMEFSAVGFDPSKTRAMVYMAHHCGSLCGGGTHHLLQKVDGRWQPARLKDVTQCIWMS
jgi:hypothetical protein